MAEEGINYPCHLLSVKIMHFLCTVSSNNDGLCLSFCSI